MKRLKNARCLFIYPWDITVPCGARLGLINHARALRNIGILVDVFAPSARSENELLQSGCFKDLFERILVFSSCLDPVQETLFSLRPFLSDSIYDGMPGRDPGFLAAAAMLSNLGSYDIAEISYTRCSSIRNLLRGNQVKVLFTHDLDSADLARRAHLLGVSPPFTLHDEVERMKGFDLITVVGPTDYSRISALDPTLPLVEVSSFAVENGQASLPPGVVAHSGSPKLLYVASAADFNQLALRWLLTHVWPRILRHVPSAELLVIGELGSTMEGSRDPFGSSVKFLGVVDDLRPWVNECCVSVAPYYIGDGVKLKVLEALSFGLPVVTTSLGITNTRLEPGRHLFVADTAEDFSNAVVSLLSSPSVRTEIAAEGQAFVTKNYQIETACKAYQEKILQLLDSQLGIPNSQAGGSTNALAPEWIEQSLALRLPSIIWACRTAGLNKVAVFGAGGHTRILLPLWRANDGPDVVSVIVSKRDGLSSFLGLPVYEISHLSPDSVDAILLSSHKYESEMARTCHKYRPDLPVIHIWESWRLPETLALPPRNPHSSVHPSFRNEGSCNSFFELHRVLEDLSDTIPRFDLANRDAPGRRPRSKSPQRSIPLQDFPNAFALPVISFGSSLYSTFQRLCEKLPSLLNSECSLSQLWVFYCFLNHARHIPGELWICGSFPINIAMFFLESVKTLSLAHRTRILLSSQVSCGESKPQPSKAQEVKGKISLTALSKHSSERPTYKPLLAALQDLGDKRTALIYLRITFLKDLRKALDLIYNTQSSGGIILIEDPSPSHSRKTQLAIEEFGKDHSLSPIFLPSAQTLLIRPSR